jgi:hypothetical protein
MKHKVKLKKKLVDVVYDKIRKLRKADEKEAINELIEEFKSQINRIKDNNSDWDKITTFELDGILKILLQSILNNSREKILEVFEENKSILEPLSPKSCELLKTELLHCAEVGIHGGLIDVFHNSDVGDFLEFN